MTAEEINGIYYINKEIAAIKRELQELRSRNFYKSTAITGMPKGESSVDIFTDYTDSTITLESMLAYNLKKLQEERKKYELFLNTIEDPELRMIIRLRAVNNMSWEEIGEQLGMDRRTASRKFYKFFKKGKVAHNARPVCDNMVMSKDG